jgi:uncharacterized Fe-S cluster-containing radical SAM superfamily protein
MYDPIALSTKIENLVVNGIKKKYYRFRGTGFYGGISTADTVGCNLRCKFCWSGLSVWNAKNTGEFYSPKQVVDTIKHIARKKGYNKVRISGGEPTIGRNHLITLLEMIDSHFTFILETNGILLGLDTSYLETLSQFTNVHVRVCLKGSTKDEFSFLTGANEEGFEYQLKALEQLRDASMSFNIAFVSTKNNQNELYNTLKKMNLNNVMIEKEEIKLYPQVKQRLKNEGILNYFNITS